MIEINAKKLSKLQEEAKVKANIDTYINKEICVLKSSLARRLIGFALVCAPKLSMRIFERIMSLIIAAFLVEIDYPFKVIGDLASCVPSRRSLYTMLEDFTADIMIITAYDIQERGVSLMCDKGESRSSNETKKKHLTLNSWHITIK